MLSVDILSALLWPEIDETNKQFVECNGLVWTTGIGSLSPGRIPTSATLFKFGCSTNWANAASQTGNGTVRFVQFYFVPNEGSTEKVNPLKILWLTFVFQKKKNGKYFSHLMLQIWWVKFVHLFSVDLYVI